MKVKKRIFSVFLVFIMLLSSATSFAHKKEDFKDLKKEHWAYESVMKMVDLGILSGFPDNTFKPDAPVSRAEFAKMMVLTLGLDLTNPSEPSFKDVGKNDWAYKYVETAKYYLTGYRTNNGDYYKPKDNAVREDMAVAIVKGLGINAEATNLSVLDKYSDKNSISPNLKKYVAAAINEGIMIGANGKFNPTATLTRAEAAVLLCRLITSEKVTYDKEEKVTYGEGNYKPYLTSSVSGNSIKLSWTKVDKPSVGFKSYQVSISKSDSTPSYPDNGYLKAITDINTLTTSLKAGDAYNGGDFGGTIKAGETYYVAVTAVYEDGKKQTSNVITITIPKETVTDAQKTPVLSAETRTEDVKLTWTKPAKDGLQSYIVVISKNDSTPTYPENGFFAIITDLNDLDKKVKAGDLYIGGDFGDKIKAGETYYATVCAVYKDGIKTSNVVKFTVPAKKAPTLTATTVDQSIKLDWSKTSSDGFVGYYVVLSKSDSTPTFPENGFAKFIEKNDQLSYTLKADDIYNNGDLGGKIKGGETYYASVVAVYKNASNNVVSNVVKITVPQSLDSARTPKLSYAVSGNNVTLSWNKTASEKFLSYNVVISKGNSTPSYPDNGYATYITDVNITSYTLKAGDGYINGDFGGVLKSGEKYYITLTANYEGQRYTSNVITLTMP